MRSKLEDLKELRDLVRSLGRGGGWGPLRRAPIQYLDMKVHMLRPFDHPGLLWRERDSLQRYRGHVSGPISIPWAKVSGAPGCGVKLSP